MKSIFTICVWGLALFATAAFTCGSILAQAPQEKEWTLLVFLNGDNNLDPYGTADMKEMETVGSNDKMNVIVLRDTSKASVSSKIYYVEKGASKVVKDYGSNIDMGDYKTLVAFFKYAKENYPAKRYFIDVWNHGAGWERRSAEDIVTRGISYDDNSGNHITTPQLGEAFRQMKELNGGRKIDIFGMDACLMEMAEVIYEVKDGAAVVLGSEDTEPGDGWDYRFLGYLANDPTMDGERLADIVEREYAKSYNGGSQGKQSVQGSAVSTDRLIVATGSLNKFLDRLIYLTAYNNKAIARAIKNTQAFYYSQCKDAIHFVQLVIQEVKDAELKSLGEQAVAELKDAVVANYVTGTGLSNSHGFSVWIPSLNLYNSRKADYAALAWGKETNWQKFLHEFYFPSKPVLGISEIKLSDENQDSFVTPAEKVSVQLKIENESSVEAKGVIAHLITTSGISEIISSVHIPVLPKGTSMINGLIAQVDSAAAPGFYDAKIVLEIPGAENLEESFKLGVDKQYTIENYSLESDHDYLPSTNKVWTITKPGVVGIRLHFSKIMTEAKYDFVSVLDSKDNVIMKLDGKGSNIWSPLIEGDTVKVKFTSDSMVNDWGFAIDRIAY